MMLRMAAIGAPGREELLVDRLLELWGGAEAAVALGEVHPTQAEVVLAAEELGGRGGLGVEFAEELVAEGEDVGLVNAGRHAAHCTHSARNLDRWVKSLRGVGVVAQGSQALEEAVTDRRPRLAGLLPRRSPAQAARVEQRRLLQPALTDGDDPGQEQVVVESGVELAVHLATQPGDGCRAPPSSRPSTSSRYSSAR